MDGFPIPDLDWVLISWAAAGLLAVAIILYLRSRSESVAGTILTEEASFDDPNVEYEWVVEPRVWGTIMLAVAAAVPAIVAFFFVEELREIFSSVFQIGIVLIGLISSFFANAFKRFRYRITTTGLLRSEIGKKGDPKLLFTWKRLVWFKPGPSGFRYYFKPGGEGTRGLASSGRVEAGDRALLVNAIIMSRGVPTSPPNRRDNYQESRHSFENSEHSNTSGQ